MEDILEYYHKAKQYCIDKGYGEEINDVEFRKFENIDAEDFFLHYVYVVFNSGISNRAVESMYYRFLESKLDINTVAHKKKREAIETAKRKYREWYHELTSLWYPTDELKLDYLDTLPMIGPITKFHLARNLGLNVAKPDRHLMRLCKLFGYNSAYEICKYISEKVGDRIGTVDVVLWRHAASTGTLYIIKDN